jgi:hypothetical protein
VADRARSHTAAPAFLYFRPAESEAFQFRIPVTDEAALPFWSPDSRSIAFSAGGRLKKVEASGGAPKDIGEAQGFGAWSREGTIVFGSAKGLYRVSAEGGKPEAITTVEKPETGHFWPSFLPDGRQYVYLARYLQRSHGRYALGRHPQEEVVRGCVSRRASRTQPTKATVPRRRFTAKCGT